MKAERLIKELEKNPNAEVRIGKPDGFTVLCANVRTDDDVIWLVTEENIDMAEELERRFHGAIEDGMDELDFYEELLEVGITVDTVRKFMGDECAEHMKQFCIEHGLLNEGPVKKQNRVDAIKAFKERQDAEAAQKESKEKAKTEVLKQEIRKLYPRITEMISVAKACVENGIPLKGHLDLYDRGTFIANGCSHRLGFIISGYNSISKMGIIAGGAYGQWDFHTDGVIVTSVNHNHSLRTAEPKIEHMEKFLKDFDEFEHHFYYYVDEVTSK